MGFARSLASTLAFGLRERLKGHRSVAAEADPLEQLPQAFASAAMRPGDKAVGIVSAKRPVDASTGDPAGRREGDVIGFLGGAREGELGGGAEEREGFRSGERFRCPHPARAFHVGAAKKRPGGIP
jgi:hypothetical protein